MSTVTLAQLKRKWGGVTHILPGDAIELSQEEWEQWVVELEQTGVSEMTMNMIKMYGKVYDRATPEAKSLLRRIVEGVYRGVSKVSPGSDDV